MQGILQKDLPSVAPGVQQASANLLLKINGFVRIFKLK